MKNLAKLLNLRSYDFLRFRSLLKNCKNLGLRLTLLNPLFLVPNYSTNWLFFPLFYSHLKKKRMKESQEREEAKPYFQVLKLFTLFLLNINISNIRYHLLSMVITVCAFFMVKKMDNVIPKRDTTLYIITLLHQILYYITFILHHSVLTYHRVTKNLRNEFYPVMVIRLFQENESLSIYPEDLFYIIILYNIFCL